jgi:hypothetical protein
MPGRVSPEHRRESAKVNAKRCQNAGKLNVLAAKPPIARAVLNRGRGSADYRLGWRVGRTGGGQGILR